MTGAVQQAQRPMLSRISCCRQRWCWLVLVLWSNNLRRIQPTFGVTLRRVAADPNHTKAVTSSAIITIQIRFGRGLFWIPHTTHTLPQPAKQQLRFIWHPPKTRYATTATAATTASHVTVTQDKKMDLGEAYMKAQQLKIESAAVTANTKTRTDLVIAMMVQKKTPEEIAAILKLAGF